MAIYDKSDYTYDEFGVSIVNGQNVRSFPSSTTITTALPSYCAGVQIRIRAPDPSNYYVPDWLQIVGTVSGVSTVIADYQGSQLSFVKDQGYLTAFPDYYKFIAGVQTGTGSYTSFSLVIRAGSPTAPGMGGAMITDVTWALPWQ
jgi:hypothetical protein